MRFNPQISACDWPDAVDCRDEREREANTLISGARMVWTREEHSQTTEKSIRNILDFKSSPDKLVESLVSSSVKESQSSQSNSEIKESRKKITNVAEVLARVKGKLLPAFLREGESTRLAKHVPAKAILVQTFRPEEGGRYKYPRGANLV